MKQRFIKNSKTEISPLIMGCMRLTKLTESEAANHIQLAYDNGVNFFDHADIYDGGKCESLFGSALKKTSIKREDIFVQSKCGIVCGKMYDLSKKHIIESVEEALQRLQLDYLDSLLLHRPDALIEPEEVAEAFSRLEKEGKVKYFGVSNFNTYQIKLLQKYVEQPLVFNQMQLSPAHCPMITQGLEVNMSTPGAVNRDGSVLDYCRLEDITIQAWSPFQHGFIEGPFLNNPAFEKLNTTLDTIGKKYNVPATTIVTAWLLRHPCNMQVIAGTMNKEHFLDITKARNIDLSREEWYEIYMASGNMLP